MSALLSQIAHSRRRIYHSIRMGDYPLFCNGIPKAGTHLLLNILRKLPKFQDYDRRTHFLYLNQGKVPPASVNTISQVRKRMRNCYSGEIMKVHLAYEASLANVLREMEAKHVVMFRDPRAIILSMADWWDRVERPDLWAWRYYHFLPTREERIKFLIEGWPKYPKGDYPADVVFPNLGQRMAQYLPWVEDYQSMVIRYEDLVNEESTEDQLRKLVAYLQRFSGHAQQQKMIDCLAKGMMPDQSKTYVHGKPLRWQRELTAEAIALCQKVAGKEIEAMGYTLYHD